MSTKATVKSFERPPFDRRAGKIDPLTGAEWFWETEASKLVVNRLMEGTQAKARVWLLGGGVGSGKTWLLSWLLREGAQELENKTHERWAFVGFYYVPSGPPDRALLQALFSHADDIRVTISKHLEQNPLRGGSDPFRNLIRAAVRTPELWAVLTGASSSYPKSARRARFPNLSTPANRTRAFIALLEEARSAGIENLVFLVDEFEATVIASGARGIEKTAHSIRQLYDEMETAQSIPRVQLVLSATTDIVEDLNPGPDSGRPSTVRTPSALSLALRERLSPNLLLPPLGRDEAMKLANHRIELARNPKRGRKYIPYAEQAIAMAFEVCLGSVRTFVGLLEAMYLEAYASGSEMVTTTIAERIIDQKGYSRKKEKP